MCFAVCHIGTVILGIVKWKTLNMLGKIYVSVSGFTLFIHLFSKLYKKWTDFPQLPC